MSFAALTRWLNTQTWLDLFLWGGVLLAIGAVTVWLLRLEQRQFAARGKGRAWGMMRLLALPMLAITIATVVLTARSVSGPAALAMFYLALLVLGPLVWIGLHGLAGRLQSPRLTRSESLQLAISGLVIFLMPPLFISLAQGPIFSASHQMQAFSRDQAPEAPLLHLAGPLQHWQLHRSGALYTQTLHAPAGIQIERVEAAVGDHWSDIATSTFASVCRHDNDLHLAWSTASPPPQLRVFWREAKNELMQSKYRVDPAKLAGLPERPFTVGWREDGFDLAVPLSRYNVQLGWRAAGNASLTRSQDSLQVGENFANTCVMPGYRRIAWQTEGPIDTVSLRFHPPLPAEAWQADYTREPDL